MQRKHTKLRRPPLAERLWALVNKEGPIPSHVPELGPCWVWNGKPGNRGYGAIRRNGKTIRVHRLSYELATGIIPRDFERDMEAIKRVQALAHSPRLTSSDSEPVPAVVQERSPATTQSWPGLRRAIREIIGRRSQPFTLHDVVDALTRLYPDETSKLNRNHISGELWRIKERKEIRVIEEGAGSKAAIYEKVTATNGAAGHRQQLVV